MLEETLCIHDLSFFMYCVGKTLDINSDLVSCRRHAIVTSTQTNSTHLLRLDLNTMPKRQLPNAKSRTSPSSSA
jgi:hypothetical protein